MEPLLMLVHRIPYPPNKGDKIRSYHMLRYLAEYYDIYLGAFIDDKYDYRFVNEVEKYCKDICIRPLHKKTATLKSLLGLVLGEALSVLYYRDRSMARWCRKITREKSINKVIVYSSSMAQYVDSGDYSKKIRIIDFVDIDSDKWQQYSKKKKWPWSWLYAREGQKLFKYECAIAAKFNKSFFVSESERDLFRSLCAIDSSKINYYDNGVDFEYFTSSIPDASPYQDGMNMVFTGAMDYWPNIDAVLWFHDAVFVPMLKEFPALKLTIVGTNPADEVVKLGGKSVMVTGRVPDVRPYLKHANLVIAPLRIARGVQNKVLEALSMEKAIVASPEAIQGIQKPLSPVVHVCETAVQYIDECRRILTDPGMQNNPAGREYVVGNYSWNCNLQVLKQSLDR